MEYFLYGDTLRFNFLESINEPEMAFFIKSTNGEDLKLTDDNVTEMIPSSELLDKISESFMQSYLGLFSFFNKAPAILEQIKKEGIACGKSEGEYFAIIPRPYVLGLFENTPEALKELSSMLTELTEKTMELPNERMRIQIQRGFGSSEIAIRCESITKETEMNQWFNEKINSSLILSQWRNNLISGIENTWIETDNLSNTIYVSSLMDIKDQLAYSDKLEPFHDKRALKKLKKHKK